MRAVHLVLVAAVLTACGQPREATPGQLGAGDLTPVEREAFIYAAAVHHLVEDQGGAPKRIYVLDRDSAGQPIPRGVQDRVREELALLGRVVFVSPEHEAARAASDGDAVKQIVITLGPVPAGRDRVEVEASSYRGRSEDSQTLVLERHGLRWQVTGTAGPAAIS